MSDIRSFKESGKLFKLKIFLNVLHIPIVRHEAFKAHCVDFEANLDEKRDQENPLDIAAVAQDHKNYIRNYNHVKE